VAGFPSTIAADRGEQAVYVPDAPAAGSNLSWPVSGQAFLRIVAATATLATDSNVANRLFSLDFIGGQGVTPIRNAATLLVTASTGATVFQWDHAHTVSEWQTGTPVFAPLVDMLLPPGWTVRLTVDNIQAGDAITAVKFVTERYFPPRSDDGN
jgi:hypothetical protein